MANNLDTILGDGALSRFANLVPVRHGLPAKASQIDGLQRTDRGKEVFRDLLAILDPSFERSQTVR